MDQDKRITELEVKQAQMRAEHNSLKQDVADIKAQVSNHIPTEISEVKKAVYELRDKHVAANAVRSWWDSNLKRTAIIIGIAWTILKAVEVFRM